ncbi:MAG: DNA-directed RNA polymerase subunit omega [Clostridia bacterium]|nr:DNA-directed RNA polymerase subunit omega [Clostridia bacterium]
MLLYPAIDVLKTKVDSKYTLAIMAAKRARDLIDGKPQLTIADNTKPISIATAEIADDLISYERAEEALIEDTEEAAEEAAEA